MALAGGQQLQGHSGFWSVLLPRFTGHFFYPGQLTKKSLCIHIDRCQLGYFYHSRANGSIPVLHLAGELLEDFGRAAVVLQLGLNQRCQLAHLLYLQHTHTHICCFHYHPCSVSMLGLSLAPHSMAQDGTLLKTVTMATREPC